MRSFVLGLALALASAGCAAMMKQSPAADWEPQQMPRCSQSEGGVVLDGVFVALYGLGSIAAMSSDEGGLGLGLGILGGVHLASAISGHNSARRCKKALDQHEAWIMSERRGEKEPAETYAEVGTRNGRCYRDGTCEEGLTCHPDEQICVLAHLRKPASKPGASSTATQTSEGLIEVHEGPAEAEDIDETAPGAGRKEGDDGGASPGGDSAPARQAPARTGAQPPAAPTDPDDLPVADKPTAAGGAESRPRRSPPRNKRPPPPADPSGYRDFWREVRP